MRMEENIMLGEEDPRDGGQEDHVYEDGLRKHYDAIIIGTGLVESILACAIQLLPGKKVLHVDSLGFYGRELSTVNLFQMMDICKSNGIKFDGKEEEKSVSLDSFPNVASLSHFINDLPVNIANHHLVAEDTLECFERPEVPRPLVNISSFSTNATHEPNSIVAPSGKFRHPSCLGYTMQRDTSLDKEAANAGSTHPSFFGYVLHNKITPERARHEGRKFSLDLTCKLMLAGGSMVECMINSDVGRYLEFKAIENIYLITPGLLYDVPCSKGDVFNSKLLSAIEKRQLMKFLQFATDWGQATSGEEVRTRNERELSKGAALSRPQNKVFSSTEYAVKDYEFSPFREFMASCKLPEKLQEIILYALCLDTQSVALPKQQLCTTEGLRLLNLHLASLGRYGNTAFLYPVYGVSEVSQAFCRMCAVWGGVYILLRGISTFVVDIARNRVSAVVDDTGRPFSCSSVVCSSSDWHRDLSSDDIICTRTSICRGDDAVFPACPRGFGIIPPGAAGVDNVNTVHVVQLNSSANVCPDGCCILYIVTTIPRHEEPEALLSRVVAYLQNATKFEELYFFTVTRPLVDTEKLKSENIPSNVVICGEEKQSIHFQDSVEKARKLFLQLYPDDEFISPVKSFQSDTDDRDDDAIMKAALDSLE